MSENRKYFTGAMVPPELEWQIGKTAASIEWISHISSHGSQNVESAIEDVIEGLKNGTLVANQFPPRR